jgi:hypothetical protein
MKCFLLVLALALMSSVAGAQDVCPEFANVVNVIVKGGTAGKELGVERAIAKQKKKGLYRGWDQSIRLEGPAAKYAVKPTHSFAFKPVHANIHPRQQIKLYAFTTNKGYRELSVGGTTQFGGSKDRKTTDDSIPLKFKKISEGCYQITSEATLTKGEYAFSLGSVSDVQGTNAGWGTTVEGQVWYGFSIK